MYNEIWMQLLEKLDNIHQKSFTLTPSQIEAVLTIDQELMRKDAQIEELQINLGNKRCSEKMI